MTNTSSDINDIDWGNLKTHGGTAANVPFLLQALTLEDTSRSQDAFEQLAEALYHQGTVYQATPSTIPFLLQIVAQQRNTPVTIKILALLSQIAFDEPQSSAQPTSILAEDQNHSSTKTHARQFLAEAREAIHQGLPFFLDLLNKSEPLLKLQVCHILWNFPDDTNQILLDLQNQVEQESDDEVNSVYMWLLEGLLTRSKIPPDTKSIDNVRNIASGFLAIGRANILRIESAMLLLALEHEKPSSGAMDLLVDVAAHPEKYPHPPWGDALLWSVCTALCRLGSAERTHSFERIFQLVSKPETAHTIAISYLNYLFRDTSIRDWGLGISRHRNTNGSEERIYSRSYEIAPIKILSETQSAGLRAILNCQIFWMISNNLLAMYGLPPSRDEARRLLQRTSQNTD